MTKISNSARLNQQNVLRANIHKSLNPAALPRNEVTSLRGAAPSLRLDLPDAIAVPERVRKGTGPSDGLTLNRDSESPRYDDICVSHNPSFQHMARLQQGKTLVWNCTI
jgi:hypothetical protein